MNFDTAVFDLDGILLRDGVLENESKRAIELLSDNGFQILYSSGKNYWYTAGGISFSGLMKNDTIIMAENGGLAYFPKKRELHTIGKETEDIIIAASQYISRHCICTPMSLTHIQSKTPLWREPKKTIFTLFPEEISAIPLIGEQIRVLIKEENLDLYVVEHSDAVDTIPIGQNKGAALYYLHEKGDIDIDRTIAFGDGNNDIEMLSQVGLSITVKNAKENVKKIVRENNGIVASQSMGKGVLEAVQNIIDGL